MRAPDDILLDLRVGTKAALLERLAERLAARTGASASTVREALRAREALGSTGFGGGIAMPHARLAGLGGAASCFVRLARPIGFEAVDGAPVDLVFALLVPAEAPGAHLALLAGAARMMRRTAAVATLRSGSAAAIGALFAAEEGA